MSIDRTYTEQQLVDKIIQAFKEVAETNEEPDIVYLSVKESDFNIRLRIELKGKVNKYKEVPPPTLGVGVSEKITSGERLGGD